MIKHFIYLILSIGVFACGSQNHKIILTDFQLRKLDSLKRTNKFDERAFTERGLVPSDPLLRNKMNSILNECLLEIIEDSQKGTKPIIVTRYLDKGLKRYVRMEYDTEEKELIADEFDKISKILNVNYHKELNDWIYGKLLNTISNVINNQSVFIDTISKSCSQCRDTFMVGVSSYREDIPEKWIVVKCNKCGTSNSVKLAKNINQISFINCSFGPGFQPVYDSIAADSVVRADNVKLKTAANPR